MKEILGHIPRMLTKEENIGLTGLGVFGTRYLPASVHPVLHTLSPPSVEITFVYNTGSSDQRFPERLALLLNVSAVDARQMIGEAVQELIHEIGTTGSSRVEGLGSFSRVASGVLVFTPSETQETMPPAFGLSEIRSPAIIRSRKKPERNIRKSGGRSRKDRRMPVALKRSIWLSIPLIAIVLFFLIRQITPAELYARVTGNEPRPKTNPKGTVSAEVRFSAANTSVNENMIRPVRENIYRQDQMEPSVLIIGNCFSHEEYARQYLSDMRAKGFPAAGLLITEGPMPYQVFLEKMENRADAEVRLTMIRKQAPQAWILEILPETS